MSDLALKERYHCQADKKCAPAQKENGLRSRKRILKEISRFKSVGILFIFLFCPYFLIDSPVFGGMVVAVQIRDLALLVVKEGTSGIQIHCEYSV